MICSLLFFATTVNYLDRQVLSLTWKDFISPEFHWTDADYGVITGYFSLIYAFCNLFAGKFVDWMGTKKGYMWAIFIWSLAACLHAACGWGTVQFVDGVDSIGAMRALETGSAVALSVASVSVWLFLGCRCMLALGEAGNFPAAIKVTAEYFPPKDRAFSTSIFNSGSSVGALLAPATIPLLAEHFGWETAFVVIGALGFVWMGFWQFLYKKPSENPRVNAEELKYIEDENEGKDTAKSDSTIKIRGNWLTYLFVIKLTGWIALVWLVIARLIFKNKNTWVDNYAAMFSLRQTWSLVLGRVLTDGVWWFFLFWTPGYLSDQFGYKSSSGMGMALIVTLYAIVTFASIYLCKLPTYMVEKKGMNAYEGRMVAMFLFACFPLLALGAQPLGSFSAWWPAILIGFACAGHQAWSANIYSCVSDMFPKSCIGTLTGIAQCAAGLGSFAINISAGALFTYAAKQGDAFAFFGYTGKPAGYMIVFCYCAVAYLIGWACMKSLVPHYKKVEL